MSITSQWGSTFRNSAGDVLTGLTVQLYLSGGTLAYTLSEDPVGYYHHDSIDTGIYDIYIGGTISYEDIFIGSGRLKIISDKFNDVGVLSSAGIQNSAITNAKLANAAVTGIKIANTTISSSNLRSHAVTENKIQSYAVTENKIAANAVTNSKLANNSVGNTQLATHSVTGTKIAPATIETGNIANDAITWRQLADNCILPDNIAANAVTDEKLEHGGWVDSSEMDPNGKVTPHRVGEILFGDGTNIWIASTLSNNSWIKLSN